MEIISMRIREMAEEGGVPNPPVLLTSPLNFRYPPALLTSPLEFRYPRWFYPRWFPEDIYRGEQLFPGVICWHHNDVCLVVEYDMRRLRRQSQPQTTAEEEEEERQIREKRAIELQRRYLTISAAEKMPEVEGLEKKMPDVEKKMPEEEEEEEEKKYKRNKTFDSDGSTKTWTFEEGKTYDISLLLSGRTTNRDYLINNKGFQVNIHQLSGKYVLLYIMCLPDDHRHYHCHVPEPSCYGDLEELYSIFSPQGMLEIVVVALGNNNDVFCDSISHMPWLAIPHQDQESRDIFKIEFDIPYPSAVRPVLFAPNGTLVLADARSTISCYGVYGFPFTNQKICVLLDECRALQEELFLEKKMLSLTALLGDYVISSDGNKDPVSKLEGKIVGLYFFEPTSSGFQQCKQLLEIWQYLKKEHEDFEIVFINKIPFNLSYAKAKFKNEFGCAIPWYSLEVCGRKLSLVFKKEWESDTDAAGDLIVLKPDKYQPLSYFAFHIFLMFGRDAYPFTLQRAVELAKRKQQDVLVLDKFLSPEAPLRRGGTAYKKESDTTVSKLLGKRVLLLFATHSCYESGLFLPQLKRMYEKKRSVDDFEIIYISLDCNESPSSFLDCFQEMPWLILCLVPEFTVSLTRALFDVFPPRLPAIAAFGPDGHLETKESNLAFKNDFNSEYPFIQADMSEEVCVELMYQYLWDLDHLILRSFFRRYNMNHMENELNGAEEKIQLI